MDRWLPFTAWLRQQVSDRGDSSLERTDLSGSCPAAPLADQHSVQPSLPRRRPGVVQPTIPDCSTEQRLLEGYAAWGRARQEMSVLLAVPGLPAHCAPVLTAKQATALLRAISEPLISLEAGRLTRQLSCPAKLVPTEEQGLLTLWLLPNDDLTLCWQSTQPVGPQQQPAGQLAATAAATVVVCEALAHFPASSFYESDDPVAVIHTLRNDASGRSFYVRPRDDIGPLSTEQAVDQLQQASMAREAGASALPAGGPSAPRLYLWLRGRDLQGAVQGLGRLKSLLRRPITLAKRSGVPQKKLDEIASWLARVETVAAHQTPAAQQQTPTAQPAATALGEGSCSAAGEALPANEGPAAALCCTPPRQQHLPSGSPAAGSAPPPAPKASSLLPSILLGRGGASPALASARMAAAVSTIAASSQGMAMPGFPGGAALPLPMPRLATQQGAGGTPPPTASSTVSASASAVYHDRRFNLLAPVAVAVVVTSVLQGGGGAPAPGAAAEQQQQGTEGLQAEALQHASALAQEHAQAALERSGRRLMEEQLAEAVISSIRAGRAAAGGSSRQRLQRERARQEAVERRWRTALAMPKIRAAAVAASRRGKLQSGRPQLQQPAAGAAVVANPTAPSLPSPAPTSPCTPCREDADPVPATRQSGHFAAVMEQASASAMAAPTRPRSCAATPPATAETPAGAKVTLSNLHELLGGASTTTTPDSGCQGRQQHEQQRAVVEEADSTGKGEELEAGLSDSGVGTPGKVTLGGLFKLINGCLDM